MLDRLSDSVLDRPAWVVPVSWGQSYRLPQFSEQPVGETGSCTRCLLPRVDTPTDGLSLCVGFTLLPFFRHQLNLDCLVTS